MSPKATRWRAPIATAGLALLLAGLCLAAVRAQQPLPRIWDMQLPIPVDNLPDEEFVDPACGSNGGPPGLRLASFEDFTKCRAEASGLREVWFRYDDELEYIARAARDADAAVRNNAMIVLGQPVILSLLIDGGGLVQGYRIITDPHADPDTRVDAYTVGFAFKARFGAEGWDCNDAQPSGGETPVLGTFVKERCWKLTDGAQVTVESHHYHKAGQALVDPNTGLPTVNQFESSARIEVVRADAATK